MINYSIVVMGTTPGTKKENIQETKAYGTAQCSEVLDINKFPIIHHQHHPQHDML